MRQTDTLIEYYFQRCRAGMRPEEVRDSLTRQNLLDDEQREEIAREVKRKLLRYDKTLKRQRQARWLWGSGLVLLALAAGLLYWPPANDAAECSLWPAIPGSLAVACLAVGFVFQRSR